MDVFILKGAIPAQETLRAATTINPPFELSYWHYAMNVAQQWRERVGEKRNLEWDEMIDKLLRWPIMKTAFIWLPKMQWILTRISVSPATTWQCLALWVSCR